MNKWFKGWSIFIFSVAGIVLLLVVGTVFVFMNFRASLIPDEKEEEKVLLQAEQYLQETYATMKYEIYHILYDQGEQYGNFDYAAVVVNTETQTTFKVYENTFTEQMEDDILIQEKAAFIEQVKPKVYSYIHETFGEPKGMAFTPSSDVGGIPTLNIRLNNTKEEISEEMFQSFIEYLQNELTIEHADVHIMYETEIWNMSF
ncbi:hypothetical protein AAGS61_10010 [Lysinibacillus sp. KU-BSD001]|uniref:hypothetical protein n=1 Tax=Lysinibacillus sp. KU-BSD001 TaxID=3141328 RepID=UPI0036E2EEAD